MSYSEHSLHIYVGYLLYFSMNVIFTDQILEVRIASLCERVMECRDELCEYKQTTETVIYQLHMNLMELLKEYAEFDDKIKQVGS